MHKRRKLVAVALVVALAALAAVTAASAGNRTSRIDPGVTSDSILFGDVIPLSGSAAVYGTIASAIQAYFNWYNDTHHGVYGRKVQLKVYDDAYVPAQALQFTQKLVEQDKVFAMLNALGTEPNQAIQGYLKEKGVPNLFLATGASEWGTNHAAYPMQIGYQPDYFSEGKLYGQFIKKKVPQAKLAVFMQGDSYGANMLAGLKAGLGSAAGRIVATQSYQITDTDYSGYVAKLKDSGANIFMDFGTPGPTNFALIAAAKFGWHPQAVFINNVGGAPFYFNVLANRNGAGYLLNGAYGMIYFPDPSDPKTKSLPQYAVFQAIMSKYYPKGNLNDAFNWYGMSVADTAIRTLIKAGKNLSRASVVKAADSLNFKSRWLLPGIRVRTGPGHYFPISQMQLARYNGSSWVGLGGLVDARPGQ